MGENELPPVCENSGAGGANGHRPIEKPPAPVRKKTRPWQMRRLRLIYPLSWPGDFTDTVPMSLFCQYNYIWRLEAKRLGKFFDSA
jgi:hypothetical protein